MSVTGHTEEQSTGYADCLLDQALGCVESLQELGRWDHLDCLSENLAMLFLQKEIAEEEG